jgi:hypothetical protein
MMPAGPGMAREGLPLEMALEEWPPAPMETPIANRDQRLESLRREPSAGCSKGREIGERGMEVAVDKVWVGIDAGKEFH